MPSPTPQFFDNQSLHLSLLRHKMVSIEQRMRGLERSFLALEKKIITEASKPKMMLTRASTLFQQLEDLWQKIDSLETDMLSTYSNEDADAAMTKYDVLYDKYLEASMMLKEVIQSQAVVAAPPSTLTSHSAAQADIKLPTIKLQPFTGKYEDWPAFQDSFQSAVMNNTNLTPSMMLQYLKNSLTEEPLQLIKILKITDANFDIAWKKLTSKYAHKREIVFSILQTMVDHPECRDQYQLEKLSTTFDMGIQALENEGVRVDKHDAIFSFLLMRKMDPTTRREFNQTLDDEVPKATNAIKFINQRCRAQSTMSNQGANQFNMQHKNRQDTRPPFSNQDKNCPICYGNHTIYRCEKFSAASIEEKNRLTKIAGICFNCLSSTHRIRECKSNLSCKKCQGKHNTLLHKDKSLATNCTFSATQTLLPTAQILILDKENRTHQARALIDPASEATFITDQLARKLQLNRKHHSTTITGMNNNITATTLGMVNITIMNKQKEKKIECNAYVTHHINKRLPNTRVNIDMPGNLKEDELADSNFNKPTKIDCLLGADIYFQLIQDGVQVSQDGPGAINTIFGWCIMGKTGQPKKNRVTSAYHSNLDQQLQKFWELEEVPSINHRTEEEIKCEEIFSKTTTRGTTGKYIVQLPLKEDIELGESKKQAVARFKALEDKYKNLAKHYEKRQTEIEQIKNITRESAKKVSELENRLQISKRQMEKLKRQFRKEKDLKNKLQKELNEDKRKMKTTEQKYNFQVNKGLDENRGKTGKEKRKKWKADIKTESANIEEKEKKAINKELKHETIVAHYSQLQETEFYEKFSSFEKPCQQSSHKTRNGQSVAATPWCRWTYQSGNPYHW